MIFLKQYNDCNMDEITDIAHSLSSCPMCSVQFAKKLTNKTVTSIGDIHNGQCMRIYMPAPSIQIVPSLCGSDVCVCVCAGEKSTQKFFSNEMTSRTKVVSPAWVPKFREPVHGVAVLLCVFGCQCVPEEQSTRWNSSLCFTRTSGRDIRGALSAVKQEGVVLA